MSMMGGGINRNPTELLNYARSLEKSIEAIESELLNTIRALDVYASNLDNKSQEAITKFEEDYKKISTQLEEYRNLANLLRKNADAINDLISSTIF